MKVFYTHDIFSAQVYGGISRYFVELIQRLPASEVEIEILAGLHINAHLGNGRVGDARVRGVRTPRIPRTGFIRRSVNNILQKVMVRRDRDTIVHQTYFVPWSGRGVRLVVTVHDMTHELFPHEFRVGDRTSALKRQCCERADRIITVSRTTKSDLIKCFRISSEKISVIYHGVPSFCTAESEAKEEPWPAPYVLYVGSRGGYKNFDCLVRAFSQSKVLRDNFQLICFGGGMFTSQEMNAIARLGLAGLVHQVSGDDSLLVFFYRSARALVHPSRYEGFGLPLLEAMSLGCPVICSNISSSREVVEDAGVYADAEDAERMRATLESALLDDDLLSRLSARGRSRASRFSWETAARETVEVYRGCL